MVWSRMNGGFWEELFSVCRNPTGENSQRELLLCNCSARKSSVRLLKDFCCEWLTFTFRTAVPSLCAPLHCCTPLCINNTVITATLHVVPPDVCKRCIGSALPMRLWCDWISTKLSEYETKTFVCAHANWPRGGVAMGVTYCKKDLLNKI